MVSKNGSFRDQMFLDSLLVVNRSMEQILIVCEDEDDVRFRCKRWKGPKAAPQGDGEKYGQLHLVCQGEVCGRIV